MWLQLQTTNRCSGTHALIQSNQHARLDPRQSAINGFHVTLQSLGVPYTGVLIRCAGADPHNLVISAQSRTIVKNRQNPAQSIKLLHNSSANLQKHKSLNYFRWSWLHLFPKTRRNFPRLDWNLRQNNMASNYVQLVVCESLGSRQKLQGVPNLRWIGSKSFSYAFFSKI